MSVDFFSQYPYLCDTFFISGKTKITLDEVDAEDLISPYRIDLMAKLLWIEAYHGTYDREEAEQIYEDHLLAFSNHRMTEWGQPEKCGIHRYRATFQRLLAAVSETAGGRMEIGDPIPVDGKNMAMDGGHRISAAVFYKKRVPIYRVAKEIPNRYDYRFFQKRFMEEKYLLRMVEKYVTLRNCRLYIVQDRGMKKWLRKKIDRECAPVYVKRMQSTEVWILLDATWLQRSGKTGRAEELLGNRYVEGTRNILCMINARRNDLLMHTRGYACKKKLGIFCGMCWEYFKVLAKRILGRPV